MYLLNRSTVIILVGILNIALSIQKNYPQKNIFVSSANSLVDIEIRNYGFKPIRFGTEDYKINLGNVNMSL